MVHVAHGTGMASTEFNILKVSPGSVLVDMHAPGTQLTCFTSTKALPVQKYFRVGNSKRSLQAAFLLICMPQVLSLLAFLVQKYKY
jgi:hypothetical protein